MTVSARGLIFVLMYHVFAYNLVFDVVLVFFLKTKMTHTQEIGREGSCRMLASGKKRIWIRPNPNQNMFAVLY